MSAVHAHAHDLSALLQSNRLWHAQELLGNPAQTGCPTGFAALDAALPGGGWPKGQLIELLCAAGSSGEWSLVQPAVVAALQGSAASPQPQLVLVNPPCEPHMPVWASAGVGADRVLRIDTQALPQAQRHACWAAEQALHCADVAVVLAWLARAPMDALRRLQLAASTAQVLLFVVRPLAAREQSSPAALRLQLNSLALEHGQVALLKCRGSAAQTAVPIDLLSPAVRALLQARKWRSPVAPPPIGTQRLPVFRITPRSPAPGTERAADGLVPSVKAHHGLDRIACIDP